jgi:hypothetical protein
MLTRGPRLGMSRLTAAAGPTSPTVLPQSDNRLDDALAEPFAYSQAWYDRRGALLVEIVGEDGLSGCGDCGAPPTATAPPPTPTAPRTRPRPRVSSSHLTPRWRRQSRANPSLKPNSLLAGKIPGIPVFGRKWDQTSGGNGSKIRTSNRPFRIFRSVNTASID